MGKNSAFRSQLNCSGQRGLLFVPPSQEVLRLCLRPTAHIWQGKRNSKSPLRSLSFGRNDGCCSLKLCPEGCVMALLNLLLPRVEE